jgi:hypothetical protein
MRLITASGIPQQWLRALVQRDEIVRLAERLMKLPPILCPRSMNADNGLC